MLLLTSLLLDVLSDFTKIIADNQIFLCKMLEITLGMCYNVSVIEILSQNMNETRG